MHRSKQNLENTKSFWWSSLCEFCEEVLVAGRKKLSLTQQGIASKVGLSQSEISRIETGIAKPKDLPTLSAICDIYQLSSVERQKYIELIVGLNHLVNTEDILADLLEKQVPLISYTYRSGFPNIAIKQIESISKWIWTNTLSNKNLPNLGEPIAKAISFLLLEECAAWRDIMHGSRTDLYISGVFSKMNELTQEPNININNHFPMLYRQITIAFDYYIKKRYLEANRLFKDILKSPLLVGDSWEIEVIRAATISSGKSKDYSSLIRLEGKILDHINTKPVTYLTIGYLLEGLGRAYADFNLRTSEFMLKKAFEFITSAQNEPDYLVVRFIQVSRSITEVLKLLKSSKKELIKYSEPACKMAFTYGFIRHQRQILDIVEKMN